MSIPGLSYIHRLATSRTASEVPMDSYSDALRLYIEHWYGYDLPGWDTTTSSQHAASITEDSGDRGTLTVASAFNTIVHIMWRHRQDIMVPVNTLIRSMTGPLSPLGARPSGPEEAPTDAALIASEGAPFLRDWLAYASVHAEVSQRDVNPRHHRLIPDTVRQKVLEWDEANPSHSMLPTFEALENSPLNFLVSHAGPSNNPAHHAATLRHVYQELDYHRGYLSDFLDIVPEFDLFVAQLFRTISSFPNLAHAPRWTQRREIESPPDSVSPINPNDFPDLQIRKDRDSRLPLLHQAFSSFAKKLSSPDCLGILGADHKAGYKLHLGLRRIMEDLWSASIDIQHHLAVIQYSTDLDDYPLLDQEWQDYDEDEDEAPDPYSMPRLHFASRGDMELAYEHDEVVGEASQIDDDRNEGLAEDARDYHFGTIRTAKRNRERRGSPSRSLKRRRQDS